MSETHRRVWRPQLQLPLPLPLLLQLLFVLQLVLFPWLLLHPQLRRQPTQTQRIGTRCNGL